MKTKMSRIFYSGSLKKLLLAFTLLAIFSAIVTIFWHHELKYQLPTPVPQNYRHVNLGANVDFLVKNNSHKPRLLHFFNPDCPCSRFNINYFKTLVKTYGNEIDFEIVAMVEDKSYTEKNIQDKFDLQLPVLFDASLATALGVYSTPQAVIIENNKLFYRGNYNKSRYCTDPETNYAEIAINTLLQKKQELNLDELAFNAYGCELPTCKK